MVTDTHRERAAKLFNVPLEEVTEAQRSHAKRMYHIQNYGRSMRSYLDGLLALPSSTPPETSPPPENSMTQSNLPFDDSNEEPTDEPEFDAAHPAEPGEPNLPPLETEPDEEDDPR